MSTGMGTRCRYTESFSDSGMSIGPLSLLSQAGPCCMSLLHGCSCTRLTLLPQYTWFYAEFFPNTVQYSNQYISPNLFVKTIMYVDFRIKVSALFNIDELIW